MKFKTKLKELDQNQKIKVASHYGHSFWYVDTAGDMLENIDIYNTYCDAYIDIVRKRAEDLLKRTVAAFPTLEEYTKEELKMSKPDLTVEGYLKMVNAWFKRVYKLNEARQQKVEWDNNYINIANREVVGVETANPTVDEDTLNIIIQGHENGKFWMFSEAKKVPACSFAREDWEEKEEEK